MVAKRKIEIFSAGCPVCKEATDMIKKNACTSCEVTILDMNDPKIADYAKQIGIRTVPTILIDGKIADCCSGRGPDEATLKRAGLGQLIS
jgi:glutaredoxin